MMYVGVDTRSEHAGVLVASGAHVLLGPFDLSRIPTKSFSVVNQGGVTLSGVAVQINPDVGGFEQDGLPKALPYGGNYPPPNPAWWRDYETTAFQSMAPGEVRTLRANDIGRWWRLVATNREPTQIAVSGFFLGTTI